MFNLSGSEIVVILLLALVVLGPEKLPDAIRRFGRTYGELKRMSTSFQDEMRSTIEEPMREMRETANLLRDQADFSRYADEKPTSGNPMEEGLATAAAHVSGEDRDDRDPVLAAEDDVDAAAADDESLDEYADDYDDGDDYDYDDSGHDDSEDDLEDDFDEEPVVSAAGADARGADEAATGEDVADSSSSEQDNSGLNTP